jgi:hypothetical protein
MTNILESLSRILYLNMFLILLNVLMYLFNLPDKRNQIPEFIFMVILLCLMIFQLYRVHKNIYSNRLTQRTGYVF